MQQTKRRWSWETATRHLMMGATISIAAACGARTGLLPFGGDAPQACASFDAVAEPAALEVFLLLDSSGSMEFKTEDGIAKWFALRDALSAFMTDEASEGIGIAMTFFPYVEPNVPEWCIEEDACGDPAACIDTQMCLPSMTEACETDQDCANAGLPSDSCGPVGTCSELVNELCAPSIGLGCSTATPCMHLGYCDNRYSCDTADYDTPTLPLAELPNAASSIVNAMSIRNLQGSTTTLPAVEGSLLAAITQADQNPDHKVIVVVATDGMPTHCDPALDEGDMTTAIEHISVPATEALGHGVQTFVIGVFAPDEQEVATENLGQIAQAGGTESAFIINTGEAVGSVFSRRSTKFDGLRRCAISCSRLRPNRQGAFLAARCTRRRRVDRKCMLLMSATQVAHLKASAGTTMRTQLRD